MQVEVEGLELSGSGPATPWASLDRWPDRRRDFSFALISDRTGLPKPGVFERAVEVVNLLRPDFAIQIGDCIEGYTRNSDTLDAEWAEFEGIISRLEVPLFRVPGNHDVSNSCMEAEWIRRNGALHYHFRYRDVLFIVLNTQDPPQRLADFGDLDKVQGSSPTEDDADIDMISLRRVYDESPLKFAQKIETSMALEARQPAHISDSQAAWAAQVVRRNADVRWTILLMHMPTWQGTLHPALLRIREALNGRPYTAFAGHLHNYKLTEIDGNHHIRLGPSGACFVTTREEGNFDHISWITMTAAGPKVANIVLDGVLGAGGGVFKPAPMFAAAAQSRE